MSARVCAGVLACLMVLLAAGCGNPPATGPTSSPSTPRSPDGKPAPTPPKADPG